MPTTRIDEIASGIYRISTSIPPDAAMPPGFTFNQFLIIDDEPVLFHTGMRKLFPQVRNAVASVMPVDRLRWVSFSHHECDESGALSEWLDIAPNAAPLCGRMNAMYSVEDGCDRAARVLADGKTIAIGAKRLQWIDTPHVPHGWDAGLLFEQTTHTLFCSDLFAQPGRDHAPSICVLDDGFACLRDLIEPSIPTVVRPVVFRLLRRGMKHHLFERGIARHHPDEIETQGRADIDAIAAWLGDREWFITDRPTQADASAFGLLAVTIRSNLPTPVCSYARTKPNLVAFVDRALARWFGDAANTSLAA